MYFSILNLLDDASFSKEIATYILHCLFHLFMFVTSFLKWTKLHSYHLFLTLRIPYLRKLPQGKVTKFWTGDKNFPWRNFLKFSKFSEIYKKVLVTFCLLKIYPNRNFPWQTFPWEGGILVIRIAKLVGYCCSPCLPNNDQYLRIQSW